MTQLLTGAVALVVVAWLAACAEAALARISSFRAEEAVRSGRRGGAMLVQVAADPTRYLNLALLLRVACEMAAAAVVTYTCLKEFDGTGEALAVAIAVMVLVSYVAVGVSPRTIGRQHPLNTATVAAYVLVPLARVLGPIPSLLILIGNALTPGKGFRRGPFASEAELRALVDLAEAESLIEDDERRMVHSVFELGDTLVREVMVPRTDLVVIERYKTIRQALTLALRSGFSRIPVTGDSEDDIVGIVYLKDLARKTHISRDAENDLVSTAMRPATFVPDTKNAGDLLREMQQERNHVAVVIDEYGGTAGIVTIEDILEEIVGEITDEYDRELPRWRSWARTASGSPPAWTSATSASCTASRSTTTRTWRRWAACSPRRSGGSRSRARPRWSNCPTSGGCGSRRRRRPDGATRS